jgi:hypothetical protein
LDSDSRNQLLAFRLATTSGDFQFEGEYFLLEESTKIKNEIERQKNPRLAARRKGKELTVSSISEFYLEKGDIHGDVKGEEKIPDEKMNLLQKLRKKNK